MVFLRVEGKDDRDNIIPQEQLYAAVNRGDNNLIFIIATQSLSMIMTLMQSRLDAQVFAFYFLRDWSRRSLTSFQEMPLLLSFSYSRF
jgi:hypothetical protein